MDTVLLSRIQFALNIGFHFLYPPLSIGLGLMLVVMEGIYLKTGSLKYKRMTQFWIKIFALTFALGVATGLVQVFAFGTNWSRYSRYVGDVFGSALAAEGIFAFFLEAGFLGVLLFGMDRVRKGIHYFATICVATGAHFSAVWIIVANSWMQTPTAYRIVGEGAKAKAEITDFWQMVFNPSAVDRIIHVVLGCWLAGAFFVISVAAYYMLKRKYQDIAHSMMKIGLLVAMVTLVLQLFSGDSSAKIVAKYQPAKLAAMEGVYETKPYTPMYLFGWVDKNTKTVRGLSIPAGLSLLTYWDAKKPVTGLDQIPKDEWPNVPAVFQFYHIMILLWGVMFFIALMGCIFWKRGTLNKRSWLLWPMVFSVSFPMIALQAGWFTAEMGRQPWIVWKLLRTSQGVSPNINSSQVIGSITMFTAVYILLFALFIFLLDRKIKHGPSKTPETGKDSSSLYSDIYEIRKREK